MRRLSGRAAGFHASATLVAMPYRCAMRRIVRSVHRIPLLCSCLLLGASACNAEGREASEPAPPIVEPSPSPPVLSEVDLLDHTAWRNYASSLDPLPSHQPSAIDCGIAGWFVERGALEVSTLDCNYPLVEHPALIDIAEGTEVLLELVYFDLLAPEPATAHVAVFFEDEQQWELEVPIPSYAFVHEVRFRATRALSVGDPIRLHLHNHGQNTWSLGYVRALIPG